MEKAILPSLLYDDGCRFCRACADLVRVWDRRGELGLLPFSDPSAVAILSRVDPDLRYRSMHVALADGSLVSGGKAMVELLGFLPGARWLAALARLVPPVGWLIGAVYRLGAGRRDLLSRIMPERPAPSRAPQG